MRVVTAEIEGQIHEKEIAAFRKNTGALRYGAQRQMCKEEQGFPKGTAGMGALSLSQCLRRGGEKGSRFSVGHTRELPAQTRGVTPEERMNPKEAKSNTLHQAPPGCQTLR